MKNKSFVLEDLTAWVKKLMKSAEKDERFSIDFFSGTADSPVSIVGGWSGGFCHEQADLFCCSKADPNYAMCIKIAKNEGPYAYVDFDAINMPVDQSSGEVEDTSITLEWEDDPEEVAKFFKYEWERLMSEKE